MNWSVVAAIAAGGAIGSVMRYVSIDAVQHLAPATGVTAFPYGTLAVNIAGSFLVGVFARMFMGAEVNTALRLALTVGFCGGFTTFSTFSADLVALIENGRHLRALMYAVTSTGLSLAATFSGLALGSRMFGR